MPTGWGTLGSILGGGIDREAAYEEGRLRTAQTEMALARARKEQLEYTTLEAQQRELAGLEGELAKAGVENPALVARVMRGGLGSEFKDTLAGGLSQQEFGFRNVLGDPTASRASQIAASQGVQGKIVPQYESLGQGEYYDIRQDTPAIGTTPLGESMIAENQATAESSRALTNLRNAQAGDPDYATVSGTGGKDSGPSGLKTPPNMYENPNFNPALPISGSNPPFLVIPGTTADINAPRPLGVNAITQFSRVINAAGNTALDLGTIVSMPTGASTGWFGRPGDKGGILSVVPLNLANRVSPEEVRQYNAVMDTLGEQLSTIERMGVRGAQGLTERFNNLRLLEADTVYDKMFKLAQMRQTVDNGMDTLLALNSLPDSLRERIGYVRQSVNQSIPFTPRDVLSLEQAAETNPSMTLGQLIQKTGGKTNLDERGMVPQTQPAAPSVAPDQEGWIPMPNGTRVRRKPQTVP